MNGQATSFTNNPSTLGLMFMWTCFGLYLEGERTASISFGHGDENICQINRAATEAPPVFVPQAAYAHQ